MLLSIDSIILFALIAKIAAFRRPIAQQRQVDPQKFTTRKHMLSMNNIIPLLESAAAVASVVAFHEAGHFFAARFQGMKVQSFNIGYGPKLFAFNMTNTLPEADPTKPVNVKTTKLGASRTNSNEIVNTTTEFAVRCIPLGGYVAFPNNIELDDEGNIVKELTDPDLLQNRPPLQRALVISAGVLANVLLTFMISVGVSSTVGITSPVYDNGIIVNALTAQDGPAFTAGLQVNDIITKVGQVPLTASETTVEEFVTKVRRSEGTPLSIEVLRNQQQGPQQVFVTTVTPAQNNKGKVSIGVGISAVVKEIKVTKAANLADAIQMGAQDTWRLIVFTYTSLVSAFNSGFVGSDLGGPISVVTTGAKMAQYSPAALLGFIASLSVNLAVLNALPLPALDGGQLVYVLLELLFRRPVPRRVKDVVTGLSACALVALSVTTVVSDIQRLGDPLLNTAVEKNAMMPGE